MIIELADFQVLPGHEQAFEAAVAQGLTQCIVPTPGYLWGRFHRCQEAPQRFILQIAWHTLESHTVGFRGSDAFVQWRALISPHFAHTPVVMHFDVVGGSGDVTSPLV